ncbi:DEAD/DEAH box helicase [Curvivirga sp.]|uniref:DEAD/DEAH box helicase n=1 Tax=Curvivirga sp. TaxID=2856848 RepID=UPI003B58DB8B
MSHTNFDEFGLDDRILRALNETGHEVPTPIQSQAIPMLLEGKDLLAVAQTGTGKTAAFAIPTIQLLSEKPIKVGPNEVRALILAPTRELAEQIHKNMRIYANHFRMKHVVVYGGTTYRFQIQAMKKGADILVATPGRLKDLLERGVVNLNFLELLILDEADRMLDMGFIHDIRQLIEHMPEERQSLLFSATMPPKVKELGASLLQNPESIEITPESTPVDRITQKVMFVSATDKLNLLMKIFKEQKEELERVIIFTKTKWKADKVAAHLDRSGTPSEAIHGDKKQAKRQRVLNAFQKGRIKVLVATDVAARGIDVSNITHVINFELPMEPENYVHRIGRTARAGTTGHAIAFCDKAEKGILNSIERIMNMKLDVDENHDFHDEAAANSGRKKDGGRSRKSRPAKGGAKKERWSKDRKQDRAAAKEARAKRHSKKETEDQGFFDNPSSYQDNEKKRSPFKKERSFDRGLDRDERKGRKDGGDRKDRRERRDRDDYPVRGGRFNRDERNDRSGERKPRGDKSRRDSREDRFDHKEKSDFKRKDFKRGDRKDFRDKGDFDRPSRDDRKDRDRKNDDRKWTKKSRGKNASAKPASDRNKDMQKTSKPRKGPNKIDSSGDQPLFRGRPKR